MDILKMPKIKKIKATKIPEGGIILRKQWEDSFASHLSYEEKRIFIFGITMILADFYGIYLAMRKEIVCKEKMLKKLLII